MVEPLSEAALAAALRSRWLGREACFFPEIDSTNDWLKRQAVLDPALPDGMVAFTDFQTGGRGRLDRRWEAPAGAAVLCSVFLRLHWPEERANWLTMIAGLAAAEAIEAESPLRVGLKWPNDVVVPAADNGWRKLGGVLVESTWKSGRLTQVVVGVGLNVNVPADVFPRYPTPATSLLAETGQAANRPQLLARLLERLETHYEAARDGVSPQPAWAARLVFLGEAVEITGAGAAPLRGMVAGMDPWGNLLLEDAAGTLHTVAAGDVSLRRQP